MALILNNYVQTDYTVVTIYEDGHKAYSVATPDSSVAEDYIKRLKLGLFGPCEFGRVRRIYMIKRTTEVKEEGMFITRA